MTRSDYLIETRLYELDPELHRRFSDSIVALIKPLNDYLINFPEFTNHAETHSMAVVEYCNNLMGDEIIGRMNADELYILLMSCYLHDVGMGITEEDYNEFCQIIDFGDYFDNNGNPEMHKVIRKFHNEFSACFIHKYASIFDFPTEEHMFAVAQTAKGHRNVDLFNEKEYPEEIVIEVGNKVCLPYLAAILRLADEVDVAEDRNSKLLFDYNNASTEKQRIENAKHEAKKKMTIYSDRIELDVQTKDIIIYSAVNDLINDMQDTLNYCRRVSAERTPYMITQNRVCITDRNL